MRKLNNLRAPSHEFGEELKNTDASGDLPSGIVLTISFEDLGGKTSMTIFIAHRSVQDRMKHENMGVIGGWNSSLDKLMDYLAKI